MPNPHILGIDSGSATPTSSRTPTLTPKGEEEPVQALQEMIKAKTKQEKDFEVQLSEVRPAGAEIINFFNAQIN